MRLRTGEIIRRCVCESAEMRVIASMHGPSHVIAMGEIYEDRRQEPRFATAGKYSLEMSASSALQGRILDLSLNGAMLERNGSAEIKPGTRHRLSLEFTGQPPFHGDALLVYVGKERIGIEFYDMDPQNFAALSSLIEALTRAHR
jgi:hypothetical protein